MGVLVIVEDKQYNLTIIFGMEKKTKKEGRKSKEFYYYDALLVLICKGIKVGLRV